jgi:hypothetical protein
MKRLYILSITLLLAASSFAQDSEETFHGTRILNGHSVETLKKNTLQFRIEHRFGDLVGVAGGVNNFFGFDQAADIRFGFEYGITDKLMVGIGRSKGTSAPYKSLVDGFVKYRLLTQNKSKGMPVSLALFASSSLSYQPSVADISLIQNYPEFAHRMAYSTQINIARKFSDRISIALMPTYVHRNYVNSNDVNGLFALGGAFNIKVLKGLGVIGEYYHTFSPSDPLIRPDNYNSLSAGIEWITSGHNFKVVVTNSRGFGETQFIPYTFSNWLDKQFRLGFSITRNFKL